MTSIPARAALLAIDGYRARGSRFTGPCCHRLHHGGASCSAFGRRVVARHGLLAGLRLLRRRFRQCRAASLAVASSSTRGTSRRQRRSEDGFWSGALACCAIDALLSMLTCDG